VVHLSIYFGSISIHEKWIRFQESHKAIRKPSGVLALIRFTTHSPPLSTEKRGPQESITENQKEVMLGKAELFYFVAQSIE